jgi:hypothetical protein
LEPEAGFFRLMKNSNLISSDLFALPLTLSIFSSPWKEKEWVFLVFLKFGICFGHWEWPLDRPALMLRDNMPVVLNTTVPSSILKKKHNAIAYHSLREAIYYSKDN